MKNKYEDALQEAFLKSAFREAAEQDLAELEEKAKQLDIRYLSDKQLRALQRLERREERKASASGNGGWRAVAMIAVVLSLTFGLLLTQPAVRASVLDTMVSFFEKYLSFGFGADQPAVEYALGEYTVTYLPEGYVLSGKQENPIKTELVFSNGETNLYIYLYAAAFSQVDGDKENATTKAVSIREKEGRLILPQDSVLIKLVWGDESHSLSIKGTLPEKEILKIAENIR